MANQSLTVPNLMACLNGAKTKQKITERLGKNAQPFMNALIQIYKSNRQFENCDGRSVLTAAMQAHSLSLSISPGLGQAYIIPYGKQAQFQLGYKGLIQLAHRTGKYTRLHAGKVYDGQIKDINFVTGEIIFGEKFSNEVVGYVAYMRMINGFEKTLYMTKDEIEAHATKYSSSYDYDQRSGKKISNWSTNFDAMACKTVLKLLLNKWGELSPDLADAIQSDQAVINKVNGVKTYTYIDNSGETVSGEDIYWVEENSPIETVTPSTSESAPKAQPEPEPKPDETPAEKGKLPF